LTKSAASSIIVDSNFGEQKMKIHVGDQVKVLRGKDAGQTGKVISVDHAKNKAVVEGLNKVHKHVKPSQRNPQGGRLHKELPIDVSKLMVLCPKTGQPTRIGYRYLEDGRKERFARKSGVSMGVIAPPKPAYAKKA
jgi:large subunit ribosomal protein L24